MVILIDENGNRTSPSKMKREAIAKRREERLARKAEIIRLWEAGYTQKEIGQMLGIKEASIAFHVKGIPKYYEWE